MSGSHGTDSHNQPPLLEDRNTYLLDQVVQDAVAREGAATAHAELEAVGAWCGSAEALLAARQANAASPQLRAYDAAGRRLDRVEFHPAYHTLMRESAAVGLQGRLWEHLGVNATRPQGAYVARAAALYLTAGLDCGHLCALSMTSAAVPALKSSPELLKAWLPRIITRAYDPRHRPAAAKSGITLGMAITERQGGSDVNILATRAETAASVGQGACLLRGHKWFVAAPMSDGFLVLAESVGGLTAVLVPRLLPDGKANGLHLLRLKDTLGNRANATAEIEMHDTIGWRIGEAGRGASILMEMVTETRLDCAIASAGLMRAALAEAAHFTRHRSVRGERLSGLPLMRHVLADLALDVEAAVAVVFRLARAFDRVTDQRAAAWRRLMTPVVKYWTTKVAPAFIAEAMECLGGNGYVEDSRLPRLYREAPVNAIWDGAGNVMGLDVLRVLKRHPETAEIVIDDLRTLSGDDPLLKQALVRVEDLLHEPRELDLRARTLAEQLAHLSAAVVLRAHAPGVVADAFIATRLAGAFRQTYGQGLEGQDTGAILARILPE